jgi:hypothetical protein
VIELCCFATVRRRRTRVRSRRCRSGARWNTSNSHVVGVFETPKQARAAIDSLREQGFSA